MKKGRSLTVKEKPVNARFAEAMLDGDIWFWSVPERDRWGVYPSREAWAAREPVTLSTSGALSWLNGRQGVAEVVPIRAARRRSVPRDLLADIAGMIERGEFVQARAACLAELAPAN